MDYTGDMLYVGDSSGELYKFTGVFKGTPAEVTSTWPITVSANILTSPVYDTSTSNVFIADSGGFLYSYKAATGALVGKKQPISRQHRERHRRRAPGGFDGQHGLCFRRAGR